MSGRFLVDVFFALFCFLPWTGTQLPDNVSALNDICVLGDNGFGGNGKKNHVLAENHYMTISGVLPTVINYIGIPNPVFVFSRFLVFEFLRSKKSLLVAAIA